MKVKSVKPMSFGHTNFELEDGTFLTLPRGTSVPAVGDEYAPPAPAPLESHPEYAHAKNVGK